MARPSKKNQTTAGDVDAIGADDAGESADTPDIEEGKIFDYITGGPLTDTDKEQVRQRIARAIILEYGIAAGALAEKNVLLGIGVEGLGQGQDFSASVGQGGNAAVVDIASAACGKQWRRAQMTGGTGR